MCVYRLGDVLSKRRLMQHLRHHSRTCEELFPGELAFIYQIYTRLVLQLAASAVFCFGLPGRVATSEARPKVIQARHVAPS